LDPKEARRRLDLIKKMAQKYPEVAGGGQGGPSGGGGPIQITNESDYARLPSGTVYIDPAGKRRRKP